MMRDSIFDVLLPFVVALAFAAVGVVFGLYLIKSDGPERITPYTDGSCRRYETMKCCARDGGFTCEAFGKKIIIYEGEL